MRMALQINGERDMGEDAYREGDEKAQHLVPHEPESTPFADGIKEAGARDDKNQRHEPADQKHGPGLRRSIDCRALDVPIIEIEEAPGMKDEDCQDDEHAKPVKVIAAR